MQALKFELSFLHLQIGKPMPGSKILICCRIPLNNVVLPSMFY